ncbi:lanthionine synthetase C family protein [Streptomonospora sp. S1-112]|uniref:Lanthionine synthetase C family protein n=1 Tax=Streptomonospora mangrovi TaxID=2883123 RepID=A0A9X3NVB4_9ACTN|nr:lanthionine synthetase C family protein [Streptomonospora mangrovi]MDA0564876.1 lanthionine synthetase C family protein [Streptomonospora mangrovi]
MTGRAFTPSPPDQSASGWGQSLYTGAAGIALAHIEAARAGTGNWATAHQWVTTMVREPISADPDTCGLHHGAPAVAFVLHTANQPAYAAVLDQLDAHVAAIVLHRLDRAHDRLEAGQPPALAEYDLIRGLTGLGVYLLHRRADDELLRHILRYLVRLTRPVTVDGVSLPGWWSAHGPEDRPSPHWPGGHTNLGLAHGIAGPLALLSSTFRRNIAVDGQADAIARVCAWLDDWRIGSGAAAWWPGLISAGEYRTGTATRSEPQRPSWCYGTPGLARAQQLAGLALDDPARQRIAERAMAGCVADQRQLAQFGDASLCHGWAGLVQVAVRMAADSVDGETFAVSTLTGRFTAYLAQSAPATSPALLDGHAGIQLAQLAATTGNPPDSRWDASLLLGS